ncbi:MAG: hypothetical protein K5945_09460, partial [Bacteroidaceae bacterium]|nr:hypothetical protein [Bacteroidaceae bacterium]
IPQLFKGGTVYLYAGEYSNNAPVIELNSYAYNIDTNSDADKVTVKYTLLSPAKAAKINFYAGDTKVYTEELAGDDLLKGEHAVSVANSNLGAVGTAMTFDIEVTSLGVKETARIKAPNERGKWLANAVRSMAYNDNPESKNFGQIYAVEPKLGRDALSMGVKTGGISDEKKVGLYAFTPDFDLINAEDGTPGFLGGLDEFNTGGVKVYDSNAIYFYKTVQMSDDGRLFISRMGGTTPSALYEADPEDLNKPWTPVFTGAEVDEATGIAYVGDQIQHGQMTAFATSGSGENLKIWALMAGRSDGGGNASDYFAYVYDLGTNKQFSGVPTQKIDQLCGQWSQSYSGMNIATDNRGGLWYVQYRTTSNVSEDAPAMAHINAKGEVDLKYATSAYPANPAAGFWISRDGNLIAYPSGNKKVVIATTDYVPLANGYFILTPVASIATEENYASGITLDYAGNLYVASYNGNDSGNDRGIDRYVWPSKEEVVTTTPSNSRANFKVGETKTGIQKVEFNATDDIYTIDGMKVEKAKKGVNIVNGRKVLVK